MPQYWLPFFIAMAVAIVVPFVLTLIVGKKEGRTLSTERREPRAARGGACQTASLSPPPPFRLIRSARRGARAPGFSFLIFHSSFSKFLL